MKNITSTAAKAKKDAAVATPPPKGGPVEEMFNKRPVIVLCPDEDFGPAKMSMGINKCRKIVQHIEAIRAFVKKHEDAGKAKA